MSTPSAMLSHNNPIHADGGVATPRPQGTPHLEALANRGSVRTFQRGLALIQEGDRGDTLYIVRSEGVAPDKGAAER